MRQKKDGQASFGNVLALVELQNLETIMERARRANRLAKTLVGRHKRKAYRVKHQALKALATKFPHHIYVNNDPRRRGVLLVNSLTKVWALHAPDFVFEDYQSSNGAA